MIASERVEHPARAFRLPGWSKAAVGAAFFLVAGLVIHQELATVTWPQVEKSVTRIAPLALLAALACTAAGLFATSTYDALAFAAIGKRDYGYRRTAFVSAMSYALSHGGGLGLVVAAAMRFQTYQIMGVNTADIARVTVISALASVIGGVALAAVGVTLGLTGVPAGANAANGYVTAGAFAALAIVIGYVAGPRRLGPLTLPGRRVSTGQLLMSVVEWTAASGVIYLALPPETRGAFLPLLPVFGAAGLLGAASGLPGGLGVFDAVVIATLGSRVGAAEVMGALVFYRLLYCLVPLLVAAVCVAGRSVVLPFRGDTAMDRLGRASLKSAAPAIFGTLVFASGVVMLASVATPAIADRMRLLSALAPTAVVEGSHFIASLVGVTLLFLAFGIANRLRKALYAALSVLMTGAAVALAKGFDFEEAIFLTVIAALLFASRNAFYRASPLRATPLTPGAVGAIAVTLIAAGWLALFAYQHVEYRDELWWTFLSDAGAPRVLRAFVGVSVLAVLLLVWRLTRSDGTWAAAAIGDEGGRIDAAIQQAENAAPDAFMAYLGDKRLLFSPSGRSFIQYASRGRNWIALGEPTGPIAERVEMIWAFREACDIAGARPIFYAVRRGSVADFADCGLVAAKIGENAVVDLITFTLEGSDRAKQRQALSRAERDGLRFEVLATESFDTVVDQLRAVSDNWLEIHHGEEKGFSLGRFDPAYLRRFPTAVVRRGTTIVAFANLLLPPGHQVASIDLMRYGHDAPKGVMDYLFIELLLWAKARNYATFDLGMAPLAGLDNHRLARSVTHLGALLYEEAGQLYGFEGLRSFKAKFASRWEPVYIAGPAGWVLPSALGDAALLSSGGVLGLFR